MQSNLYLNIKLKVINHHGHPQKLNGFDHFSNLTKTNPSNLPPWTIFFSAKSCLVFIKLSGDLPDRLLT